MFFENILCKKKKLKQKKKDRKRERQEKRWTSYENVRETLFLSRASFLIGQIKFILMYRHFHQQGFFFSVEKFPSVENWQYKNNFNCVIKIKLYNSKIFFFFYSLAHSWIIFKRIARWDKNRRKQRKIKSAV